MHYQIHPDYILSTFTLSNKFNMKNLKSANIVAMIIGLLGIAFGIYSLIVGKPFSEYYLSIFIGVTLFGLAYFNNKALKEKK